MGWALYRLTRLLGNTNNTLDEEPQINAFCNTPTGYDMPRAQRPRLKI